MSRGNERSGVLCRIGNGSLKFQESVLFLRGQTTYAVTIGGNEHAAAINVELLSDRLSCAQRCKILILNFSTFTRAVLTMLSLIGVVLGSTVVGAR
jgi:hypothetical protein